MPIQRDESTLRAMVDDLVRAWNSCEREGFSSMFSERAAYRTGAGVFLTGRSGIAQLVGGPRIFLTDVKTDLDEVHAVMRLRWRELDGNRFGVSILSLARTSESGWEITSCESILHS